MTESVHELEQQRSSIFQEMVRLPDFRSGSITTTRGTCGTCLPSRSPVVSFALFSAQEVVNATARYARHSSSSSEPIVRASPFARCRVISVGVLDSVRL